MDRRNVLFALCFLTAHFALACGLCSYYNIQTNQDPTSFFSVFHRYTVKNGYSIINHPHRFLYPLGSVNGRVSHQLPPEIQVDETRRDYNTSALYELRGNLNIGKKLDITLFLPYEKSTLYYQRILEISGFSPVRDTTIQYSGWGDITARLQYKYPLNKSHWVRPGAGTRFSTSRTVENINQQQSLQVDHTLLPGAGIPSVFVSLEYGWDIKNSEMKFQVIKGWTQENEVEYDYGDAFLGALDYSYFFEFEKLALMATGGFYWEYADVDREYSEKLPETGGNTFLGAIGGGLTFGKVSFNTLYQHSLHDQLKGAQLGIAGRLTAGITYQI